MSTYSVPHCPNCRGSLETVARACSACHLEVRVPAGATLEGESPFARLEAEDHDLLLRFVLLSGNIKALSEEIGVSYPTMRGRLDRAIGKLAEFAKARVGAEAGEEQAHGQHSPAAGDQADAVLDALDRGALNADEALRLLEQAIARRRTKTS